MGLHWQKGGRTPTWSWNCSAHRAAYDRAQRAKTTPLPWSGRVYRTATPIEFGWADFFARNEAALADFTSMEEVLEFLDRH